MTVTRLADLIPDPQMFEQFEPEEVGWALLQVLKSQDDPSRLRSPYHYTYFLFEGGRPEYDKQHRIVITNAIMEAWGWLLTEGLIADRYDETGPPAFFVTRRGRRLDTRQDFDAYRKGKMLPRDLLHSRIRDKAWLSFLRGEHDTAVFQCFKEVEVAVRKAAGLAETDIGVDLMRKAFDPNKGPLTDKLLPKSEREALAHLFAGAIGSYKNPQSHRTVTIADPSEAVEMVLLASHLLRIVDARAKTGTST